MAEEAQQGPLGLGGRFLKYSIREVVGRGAHAWVYAAHDDFFERDVAIKVLHRTGGITAEMLRRGRTEAQLLSRLRHPNVVEVHDAGITNDGELYIVMELLRGRTLREILRARGKLGTAEALGLFIAVAGGVQAAHDLGAIHRDLKPENLLVLEDGRPKILDFGIAKIVDSAGWSTAKDVINGTVLYASPEQLQGSRATARSDVYSLGLMLYEALLGKHPCLLANPSPTVQELSHIQRIRHAPLLCDLDPSIPRHVARVVARATAKGPEMRVASMLELREELTTCLARLERERSEPSRAPAPIGWERPDGADRAATAPPVTTRTDSAREAGAPSERRRRFRQVVLAGAVVGTLLGSAMFYFVLRQPMPIPDSGTNAAAPNIPLAPAAPLPSPFTDAPNKSATLPSASAAPLQPTPPWRNTIKKHKRRPVAPDREVWIE